MNIVFRVDASCAIGTGHVMRCIVLAKKLIANGHQVYLVSRDLTGNLISYCKKEMLNILILPAANSVKKNLNAENDYASWLEVSQEQDAIQCLRAIEHIKPDWIIVDHYALDFVWHRLIKQCNANILVIDDLANRRLECHILLDQNLWPNAENRYQHLVSERCQILLGPKFALLRDSFAKLKRQIKKKPPQPKVLAFFSGTDPTGECLKLLRAAQQFSSLSFKINMIYGMSNVYKKELLSQFCPDFIHCIEFMSDLENELASSNYAIGSAGVSALERACLRIPSSLVCVAKNQQQMAEYLACTGYYRYLGLGENTTHQDYIKEIKWLEKNLLHIPFRLPESHIDGNGAARVVAAMGSFNE